MAAPKLRFKEFDGDWTFKNLSDVSSKPLYGMNSAATDFDGENKYLRITDIDEESHRFKFTKLSSPSDVIEEKYILQEGDLLFARTGASVGKSYIYDPDDGKVVFAGFLIKFGLKESVIPYFIFTQTLSEKFNNWVITNSMRSGQPGINAEEYSKWQIAFTSKPEQTKIASFLSAVDEKISQLTQKHELLSQYKQGMMQKLFSQQIRFKADDGSEFGEWEEKKLGEISKTFSGGTPQSSNKSFYEGTIPFIKSGEISKNTTEQCINDLALEKSSAKLVKKGDLLYALYGATSGQVAISQIDGAINQAVLCIRSELNTKYLLNFLLLKKEEILTTYLQGGQGNLSASILKEIYIPTPCLKEQTKSANFLSAIDQKIEVVAQQIEQAKQWKKGLLQQMFV